MNVILQVCWSLKLVGGWGVVVGRAAAGLGGTAAWVIPPLLAVEVSAHPNTSSSDRLDTTSVNNRAAGFCCSVRGYVSGIVVSSPLCFDLHRLETTRWM